MQMFFATKALRREEAQKNANVFGHEGAQRNADKFPAEKIQTLE
jgi:hypothetical protein